MEEMIDLGIHDSDKMETSQEDNDTEKSKSKTNSKNKTFTNFKVPLNKADTAKPKTFGERTEDALEILKNELKDCQKPGVKWALAHLANKLTIVSQLNELHLRSPKILEIIEKSTDKHNRQFVPCK